MKGATEIKLEAAPARNLIRDKKTRGVIAAKVVICGIAILLAALPLPAWTVEQLYSNLTYPLIQSIFTPVSNFFPIAIGDVLLIGFAIGLAGFWVYAVRAGFRSRQWRPVGRVALNTLVIAALVVLGFELLWGLNYRRLPLTQKLDYDPERRSAQAAADILKMTAEQMNQLAPEVHRNGWPHDDQMKSRLEASLNSLLRDLNRNRPIVPGNPKRSLFDAFLGAAGISGLVNPFGLEVILDSQLLPVERPFDLAHEWSHLAGFADESEASFIGLLACLRSGDLYVTYSGWLALWMHLPAGPEEIRPRLAPEVQDDLNAIGERIRRRYNPAVSRAQGRVYDQFLKANRVSSGIRSYGLVVDLMIGTRFDRDWAPVQKLR